MAYNKVFPYEVHAAERAQSRSSLNPMHGDCSVLDGNWKSPRGSRLRSSRGSVAVAQICNLLYRGFAICGPPRVQRGAVKTTPCRMQFGDTADYKSALHVRRMLLALLFWLLSFCPAQAHDPGLSTATLLLDANRVEATLVFSLTDLGQIVNRGASVLNQASVPETADLKKLSAQAFEIRFDDRAAPPTGNPVPLR